MSPSKLTVILGELKAVMVCIKTLEECGRGASTVGAIEIYLDIACEYLIVLAERTGNNREGV